MSRSMAFAQQGTGILGRYLSPWILQSLGILGKHMNILLKAMKLKMKANLNIEMVYLVYIQISFIYIYIIISIPICLYIYIYTHLTPNMIEHFQTGYTSNLG